MDYMEIYQNVMNKSEVRLKNEDLEGQIEENLRTYAYIRIIGNINEIFMNGAYKQEDYIRIKKQDI